MSKYILVCGYGWTGSSAVVDLLREYSSNSVPDVEFRIVKDPYGIAELKRVIEKGEPLNIDIAIRDYIWYCKGLNRPINYLSMKWGLNYQKSFKGKFWKETLKYIKEIQSFTYENDWWMYNFKRGILGNWKWIFDTKILKKSGENAYFSNIESAEFIYKTQRYIDSLMESDAEKKEFIVLDQAISPLNYNEESKFFNESKIIIVDRNPKDIYVDLLNSGFIIGAEIAKNREVEKYVVWHNNMRKNINDLLNDKNVLYLKFEDLIYSYEETVSEIERFVGMGKNKHINIKKHFNPEKSQKNIGIWKDYLTDEEEIVLGRMEEEYKNR